MSELTQTLISASLDFPLSDRPWQILGYKRKPRRSELVGIFTPKKAHFEGNVVQWIWHCALFQLIEAGLRDDALQTRARVACHVAEVTLEDPSVCKSLGYPSLDVAETMTLSHLKVLFVRWILREEQDIFEVCRQSFTHHTRELHGKAGRDWEGHVWELFHRGPVAATCRLLMSGQERLPAIAPGDLVIRNTEWLEDFRRPSTGARLPDSEAIEPRHKTPYCSECGERVPANASFCEQCGAQATRGL